MSDDLPKLRVNFAPITMSKKHTRAPQTGPGTVEDSLAVDLPAHLCPRLPVALYTEWRCFLSQVDKRTWLHGSWCKEEEREAAKLLRTTE